VITQEERQMIIRSLPIYKGLTILIGLVVSFGLVLAADLSNSAADVFVGTGFEAFLGLRVNEKVALATLVLTACISLFIMFMQSLYGAAQWKKAMPVL